MDTTLNLSAQTPLRKGRKSLGLPINIDWKSVDEDERIERRRSAALRQSRIGPQNDSVASAVGTNDTPSIHYSENDINSQLHIYSKLHAENKINTKNAWKLKIIDILQQLVLKNNPDVLQVAGSSLAIAGKVYGLRVDDVHAASLKLAMDLARTFSEQPASNNDENNENVDPEVNENDDKHKKARKKKRPFLLSGTKHTVNNDPKSWKGTLPKMETAVFSIKTDNNLSTIGNLYTNNIKMDPSGHKFMLLSKETSWSWNSNSDLSVKSHKVPIKLRFPNRFKICTTFEGFQVNEWDPDKENMALPRQSQASYLDQVVYDKDGIPIPELDGSMHNFFEDNAHVDNEMEAEMPEDIELHSLYQQNEHREDFRPNITSSLQISNYSYNTVVSTAKGEIQQIWAGPSHWKFKYIKGIKPVYSGLDSNVDKTKPKRKKIEFEFIDFDNLKPPLSTITPYVRKRQIKPADDSKITLNAFREESKHIIEEITSLISIPSIKICNKKQPPIEDDPPANYEYDNPNDSNYCPNQSLQDNNIIDAQEDEGHHEAVPFLGDNLTEAPETVAPFYLKYAVKSKKMDMKKLKMSTWQLLTKTNTFNEKAKVFPTTFSEIYKSLPSKLSDKMRNDLSCPLAFMALLHLCNEQNLRLKKIDESDFEILGPESYLE